MSARVSSVVLLMVTAVIWGFAFTAQRAGMDHLGPLAFNGIRFALGTLVLLPVFRRHISIRLVPGAVAAGTVLFAGAALQQWGIVYTTAGKAGFITGLYMVFVPLLGVVTGHRENRFVWAGVCLSLAGLWLLSFYRGFQGVNPGDLLVLAGAFMWAVHVRLIGKYAAVFHPGGFAAAQFAWVAALSLAGALILGEGFSGAPAAWLPLAYSGVLSVGVAFTIQVFAQKDVKPAPAALIMSLEAAFAALGGWLFLGETMASREAAGALLMFIGMGVSQIRRRPLRDI
jgi:drug/metabolite transporter (DMT)-like permease